MGRQFRTFDTGRVTGPAKYLRNRIADGEAGLGTLANHAEALAFAVVGLQQFTRMKWYERWIWVVTGRLPEGLIERAQAAIEQAKQQPVYGQLGGA